jgi:hypothetical protein
MKPEVVAISYLLAATLGQFGDAVNDNGSLFSGRSSSSRSGAAHGLVEKDAGTDPETAGDPDQRFDREVHPFLDAL